MRIYTYYWFFANLKARSCCSSRNRRLLSPSRAWPLPCLTSDSVCRLSCRNAGLIRRWKRHFWFERFTSWAINKAGKYSIRSEITGELISMFPRWSSSNSLWTSLECQVWTLVRQSRITQWWRIMQGSRITRSKTSTYYISVNNWTHPGSFGDDL